MCNPKIFSSAYKDELMALSGDTGGRQITGYVYKGRNVSEGNLPLYISVDKDIMDTSECITNWDQGDLTLSELGELIGVLSEGRRVIGADICGGLSENDPGYYAEACTKNTASDVELIKKLKKIIGHCQLQE